MNRTMLAVFALAFAAPAAHAADAGVTIVCADQRLPRLADVGAVTANPNAAAAYGTREMLMHQAARICRNPSVASVRFVPDSIVTVEPMRTVAAR
jgi:hypothetical protein